MKPNEVRRIAMSLPGATERETWGSPTFRVRDKIFLTMSADGAYASIKARKTHQQTIIASNPRTFSVAPYVGRHGWVHVRISRVGRRTMEVLIVDAWRLTAPRRSVAAYDDALSRHR